MIAYGLRGLARLVALVVLVVLAVLSGATAIGAIISSSGLDRIATSAQGPEGRRQATDALRTLQAGGPTDTTGIIIGGAMLVGGLLVAVACVVPARSRLVRMGADGAEAQVSARPRALAAAGRALAEGVPGVQQAKVRVRGRRRKPGGRLRVKARGSVGTDASSVGDALTERIAPLAEGFALRPRVRARTAPTPKTAPTAPRRVT